MIDGTDHFPGEADAQYARIFAGAAWPAARPGFVAVVGEHRTECVGGVAKLVVLDEAQDLDLWRLVEKLAALWSYYHPEEVLVDAKNPAAIQFCAGFARQGLVVHHSLLCAMEGPMGYALPILRRMWTDLGRLVIPGASRLQGELCTVPSHEDPASLKLVDYPAVAALAFAVLGLEQTRPRSRERRPTHTSGPGRILG